MGVPAFFRCLEKQTPDITNYCVEADVHVDPQTHRKYYGDTSKENPNGIEFDNLYLDMNGIIHPCSHPEDRPSPRNEDEIFIQGGFDKLTYIEKFEKLFLLAGGRIVSFLVKQGLI